MKLLNRAFLPTLFGQNAHPWIGKKKKRNEEKPIGKCNLKKSANLHGENETVLQVKVKFTSLEEN